MPRVCISCATVRAMDCNAGQLAASHRNVYPAFALRHVSRRILRLILRTKTSYTANQNAKRLSLAVSCSRQSSKRALISFHPS
jgi:pantothenate synthetase